MPYCYHYTPSQKKKEPPFLGECTEYDHQHQVEHDALTQHPAKDTEEEVVEPSSHHSTGNLEMNGM